MPRIPRSDREGRAARRAEAGWVVAASSETYHHNPLILRVLRFVVEQASPLAPAQARTLVLRNNPHAGCIPEWAHPEPSLRGDRADGGATSRPRPPSPRRRTG